MGYSAYSQYYQVMSTRLYLSLKRNAYNHCILLVLTQEAEAWSLRMKLKKLWTSQWHEHWKEI